MENVPNGPQDQQNQKKNNWTAKDTIRVIVFVGVILAVMLLMSRNRNHTTMSAGGKEHTCTYCGSSYKGAGYYHQMDDCYQSSTDPGYNQCCSRKCCSEDWAKNGSGKFH